jgi:hypothetical protein
MLQKRVTDLPRLQNLISGYFCAHFTIINVSFYTSSGVNAVFIHIFVSLECLGAELSTMSVSPWLLFLLTLRV